MANNNAYLFTDSGICIFTAGKQFTVPNDHPNLNKIKKLIKDKKFDGIQELVDVREGVTNWLSNDGDFKLTNDQISLNGEAFDSSVVSKVLSMMSAGHSAEPLFAFLRKVRENPSKVAQSELLLFCVANNFMIHEDGDILAYKGVKSDFKDIHSGTIDNSVGQKIKMARYQVDDQRDRTCSTGLHFASFQYASTWAGSSIGHVMVMKINPRDVVSIPSDYNNQKGRCCSYEVIAELNERSKPLASKEVYSDRDAGVAGGTSFDEKELARKEALLKEWEDAVEAIYDNGYNIDYDRADILESRMEGLQSEIFLLKRRIEKANKTAKVTTVEDSWDDSDEEDFWKSGSSYDDDEDDDLPF